MLCLDKFNTKGLHILPCMSSLAIHLEQKLMDTTYIHEFMCNNCDMTLSYTSGEETLTSYYWFHSLYLLVSTLSQIKLFYRCFKIEYVI